MARDRYELTLRKKIAKQNHFLYVGAFSEEGIARALRDDTWYYIDRRGRSAFAGEFGRAYPFHDGAAVAHRGYDTSCAILDPWGRAINREPLKSAFWFFEDRPAFDEGLALVELRVGGWEFIGRSGALLGNRAFKEAYPFEGGIALVRDGDHAWYIDKTGKNVFGRAFDNAWSFGDGMAIMKEGGKFFVINHFGERVSRRGFLGATGCSEGFAAVRDERGWYFMDRFGRPITKERFDFAEYFSEGYAIVGRDKKANFLSVQGMLLLPEWIDDAWEFENGRAVIVVDKKRYLIDKTGVKISHQPFDSIFYRDELGWYHVGQDRKYHCANDALEIVSPAFDTPLEFEEGLYRTFSLEERQGIYIDPATWQRVFV